MTDIILELLKTSGADAWELIDQEEKGWEFYFIRRRLDQHRVKLVRHLNVKIYRRSEDGASLGSASGEIPPSATRTEAEAILRRLYENAAWVMNPYYTLNPPATGIPAAEEKVDVKAIARDFLETLAGLPETENEDLNSCEVFVSELRRRYRNSEGADVLTVSPSSLVEAVVNARREGHEIELYRMYRSGGCDRESLAGDLTRVFRYGRDRLTAEPTPALGKTAVLFTTDDACEIYRWFIDRMSAGMRYRHMSDWERGKPVAAALRGDKPTVEAVVSLPNSSGNGAFDAEGAPVRPLTLIREGIAEDSFGSRQFSQYLGLERSCLARNFVVSGGTATEEELRAGDWLEVVEFSAFQVDPFSGDLAGEIRLGYWHHNGTVSIVTGGSVSGNMSRLAENMRMSAAQRQYDCLLIPAVTRLEDVSVAGV